MTESSSNRPAGSLGVQPRNPLHGITLEAMLTELVAYFGWAELGQQISIRCFQSDPSISSSLKFLRKTPWARAKVESLYLFMQRDQARMMRQSNGSPSTPNNKPPRPIP